VTSVPKLKPKRNEKRVQLSVYVPPWAVPEITRLTKARGYKKVSEALREVILDWLINEERIKPPSE
jgi:Arc/MetJ-type ribon-helix-helix transcriptional regulator